MRETKIIELPLSKARVEVYSYITGGEKEELVRFLLQGVTVNPSAKSFDKEISLTNILSANEKAFSMLVVSFNGSKDKIIESIKALRVKDYDYLKGAVDAITNDSDFLADGATSSTN